MKKFVFFILVCVVCAKVQAQELTVGKLDAEWKKLYSRGCEEQNQSNLDSAIFSLEKSLHLLKENDAVSSNSYVFTLLKLAEAYEFLHDNDKLAYIEKEMTKIEGQIKPGTEKFLNYNYCLAVFYSNISQYKKAISIIDKTLLIEAALKIGKSWKSKLLHRKAMCYYCLGNIEEAINEELQILNMQDSYIPEYSQALVYFMFKNKDFSNMDQWLQKCYDGTREPILRKFLFSNEPDRASYWAKNGLFFTDYLPLYTSKHPDDVFTSYCYNAALLAKGILLTATNKTSDMVFNSGDKGLIDSYTRYLLLKSKKQRSIDEDFEIDALQSIFLKYQKEHKELYRNDFRINWKNIQEKLTDTDLAIEFISYTLENGTKEYAALTLKKGYASPHYIKLCTENDITAISTERQYVTSSLYNLIWLPLEKELNGMQDIYFAPTGILFQIGIEYLMNEDEININNIYAMHRLSSTKELLRNKRMPLTKNVALFGGINYDAPLTSYKNKQDNLAKRDTLNVQSIDSTGIRALADNGRIKFLPGTLKEVSDISNILQKDGKKNVFLYVGNDGNELNFKQIGDKDCSILHIATHGFFYHQRVQNSSKNNIDDNFRNLNLRFTSDDIHVINEEKMLTRSGLILAGADNALSKHSVDNETEDGILYANEIAHLNLNTIDLVVLSACQSGLGIINNSEGVFGLQRGFKLAGVHSIMMSLWKVDDKATQILMTEFYKSVIVGKKYEQALLEAQNVLRLIENGKYDSPQYWAAFVLLDGI